MFVDDTNITSVANTIANLENVTNSELRKHICWLLTKRLNLYVAKTGFMIVGRNQQMHALSNNQTNIDLNGKSIEKVSDSKSLALVVDEHLSRTRHEDEMSKKISSARGALKRVRPFTNDSNTIQIYQALMLHPF